jgi:hypothetical protein
MAASAGTLPRSHQRSAHSTRSGRYAAFRCWTVSSIAKRSGAHAYTAAATRPAGAQLVHRRTSPWTAIAFSTNDDSRTQLYAATGLPVSA